MSKEGKNEMVASQNERSLYQYGQITLSLDLFWLELALIRMKLSPEMKKSFTFLDVVCKVFASTMGYLPVCLKKNSCAQRSGMGGGGRGGGWCIKLKPPQKWFVKTWCNVYISFNIGTMDIKKRITHFLTIIFSP